MLFPEEEFNNWESSVRPYVGLQKDVTCKDVSFDACDEYGCVSPLEGSDEIMQLRAKLQDLNLGGEGQAVPPCVFWLTSADVHVCCRKQHLRVQWRKRSVFQKLKYCRSFR